MKTIQRAEKGNAPLGGANALAQKLARSFPDRPNLNFPDFRKSVSAVDDIFSNRGCSIYNVSLLTEQKLESYIKAQSNLHLVRDSIKLGTHTHGAVVKERIARPSGEVSYYYLLILATSLKNRVMRILTLAHELGHVFLHGRLLQPGMSLKRRYMAWQRSDCALRHQMEAEANIFALLALIPSDLIFKVKRSGVEVTKSKLIRRLTYVLSCLYGESIHSQLIRERLLIEDVLNLGCLSGNAELASENRDVKDWLKSPECIQAEFEQLLDGPVWILNSSLERDAISWDVPPLTETDLDRVFNSLQQIGTISPEQARAGLKYAMISDPRRQRQSAFKMTVFDI